MASERLGGEGGLGEGCGQTMDSCLNSMSDWYTIRALDISGAAGDIVVSTTYPGLVLKQFGNAGAATVVANIIVKINEGGTVGSAITLHCPADGGVTGKFPPIHTIVKSGTSNSLILYFQKKNSL